MTSASSLDLRLLRVFDLELQRECDNQAVIGGLDRLLIQMIEDGAIPRGHPFAARVRSLPDGGYRSLPPAERRRWLEGAIRQLRAASSPRRERGGGARGASVREPGSRPATPRRGTRRLRPGDPVSVLPGVGTRLVEKFEKLGVRTVADAVTLFPRRFNDFTDVRRIAELEPNGLPQTVVASVLSAGQLRYGRRVRGSEAILTDGSATLRVIWFNMPFVARALSDGDRLVVSGKVRLYRGRLQMENPEFEPFDEELMRPGRLVPVYPGTQGLGQRTIRRAVGAAVQALAGSLPDPIPAWLVEEDRLESYAAAIRAMHAPESPEAVERARRRLALGEFLTIQVAVLMRRARWQEGSPSPSLSLGDRLDAFLAALPFPLTGAQRDALDDILADIRQNRPMLRLLQGDVGSGKTVVAFAAMLAAVNSGFQAALMAPTEILAEQHYRNLSRLLGGSEASALEGVFVPPWLGRPVRVMLLTGSLTPAQKLQIRNDAAHGGADILIGTHALIEDDVQLPRLGLAVVDEQHRFGVMQRLKLRQKGLNPHLLVMTATPIPRTLALTVYGDLEVSSIDELPPGRQPIGTAWVQPHEREEAYAFIRQRLDAGEQAYVICPLVDESEALAVRSAEEEFARLRRGPFAHYRLGLLHGRMASRQKDDVMTRFAAGEIDVLVSTSVIEVGIDVPNATVIVIEGAERFGLSQLHQFRGRVGRSEKPGYCMLFSSEEDPGPEARERLNAMVETTDGFRLAEVDLEMRGEGEAWGAAQSGINTMLRVARLTDRDLLFEARDMARRLLDRDPNLQRAEHHAIAASVKPFLERATEAN